MIRNDIYSELLSIYLTEKGKLNNQVEIELRFTPYTKQNTSFEKKDFFNIKSRLSRKFGPPTKSKIISKSDINNVRQDVVDGKSLFINKDKSLFTKNYKDYSVRLQISNETVICTPAKFVVVIERIKERESFISEKFRIDLSTVEIKDANKGSYTSYEIELELTDIENTSIDEINLFINRIMRYILDTHLVYTVSERSDLVNYANSTLHGKESFNIDRNILVQARTLKYKDLVYGGIVGNKDTPYSCTYKADGLRKLLVIHKSGIWLVDANSLNKISSIEIDKLKGTIFDGEFIPKDNRINSPHKQKYWYLIFDCISVPGSNNSKYGNREIQNKNHFERLDAAQKIKNIIEKNIGEDIIKITSKAFKQVATPQQFFDVMKKMISGESSQNYKTDGFMFTPIKTPYWIDSFKKPLTDYPAICKLKPKEMLTIDFELIKNGANKGIYLGGKKGYNVKFNGIATNPISDDDIIFDHEVTKDTQNGTIVEYAFDFKTKKLYPVRVRSDKAFANGNDVGIDVWKDIQDPIDYETILGNNFILVNKYHNVIKRELYSNAAKKVFGRLGNIKLNLLDLGTGRGGDVNKWDDYTNVIAVEPNGDNIEELRNRIKKLELGNAGGKYNDFEKRVTIIQNKSQDSEKIGEEVKSKFGTEKAHVIAIMLSMTFLWEKKEYVDSFIKTLGENIHPDGVIIFLTMDGDLVKQCFESKEGEIDLGLRKIKFNKDNSIDLEFNDSIIVEKQKEWLVNLNDIKVGLEKYGFKLSKFEKADKEKFLNSKEEIYTKMYSYGYFEKSK